MFSFVFISQIDSKDFSFFFTALFSPVVISDFRSLFPLLYFKFLSHLFSPVFSSRSVVFCFVLYSITYRCDTFSFSKVYHLKANNFIVVSRNE